MTEQFAETSTEWTLARGWEAAIKEGGRYIFFCGLGTSIATFMSGIPPFSFFMLPTVALGILGVTICHAYFANKYMLRPAYRRLDPSRRLFIRWGSRIAYANLIVIVYSPATLFSVVISPLAFGIFITVQKRVLDIQLHRQANDLPLRLFERFAIGVFIGISLCIFTGLILVAAALGYSLEWALYYFDLLPQTAPIQ